LVARAAGGHVLGASTYSKSVLRIVATEVAAQNEGVVCFPNAKKPQSISKWAVKGGSYRRFSSQLNMPIVIVEESTILTLSGEPATFLAMRRVIAVVARRARGERYGQFVGLAASAVRKTPTPIADARPVEDDTRRGAMKRPSLNA